ncbi:M23 family metallopeptidase [Streptomyces sp. NPDC059909]|uniref:M23 family metallopeptidase n=1 Tax=Streptomyces sp. NPDC059909 TaxID=3346998 RepID=UPI003650D280
MNDQHPDAGYDTYAAGSFDTDPLFGALPGSYDYDAGQSGPYDATQWQSATTGYDAYAAQGQQQQYDTTGQWDANAWNQTGRFETAAATFAYDAYDAYGTASTTGTMGQWPAAGYGTSSYDSGAYDATAWNSGAGTDHSVPAQAQATEAYEPEADYAAYGEYSPEHTGYTEYAPYSGGYYDETALAHAAVPEQYSPEGEFDAEPDTAEPGSETEPGFEPGSDAVDVDDEYGDYDNGHDEIDATEAADDAELVAAAATVTAPAVTIPAPRPARRSGGSRGRRRTPAKRSAMLTVAVPSACVMGVAGVAAASVGGLTGGDEKDDKTAVTAADPSSVKPVAVNSKLDTQLAALSADARDFGDRASRTQERIDLKARQEAERKKREEEAARREALRPKFALPVSQHGLSAYYGQAGVNWMSMHTGIDFPVSYGTPVMAATDGTVRTQWNSAYGNMAIVTAADGTETWYCHLSSTKIRSGSVKAGDVIAYSGNSGNSTGPHLHFEVRPGGGSAIDPLSWLRNHGLNPS